MVVPLDLRPALGAQIVKRSLRTRDPYLAQGAAYALAGDYAQIFARLRTEGAEMAGKRWDDDAVAKVMGQVSRNSGGRVAGWEIEAPGGFKIKTDGTDRDHRNGMEALKALRALATAHARALALPIPPPSPPPSTAPTLAQAIETYFETDGLTLKPNTRDQRRRAAVSLGKAVGVDRPVDEVSRPMAAAWAHDMIRSGLTKRYVACVVSHAAQIFEAAIRSGHLERGKNPVKGVVVMKAAEKRALRAAGHAWEPFDLPTLKRIFDPEHLKRTRQIHVRWGALIGLYTGARVSEVAQIFLRDFEVIDGTPCVRLTNDSDGQSLKTESSKRLVPIHPDLVRLGLLERVKRLREEGAERLFPDMRIDSRAGAGNSISKGSPITFRASVSSHDAQRGPWASIVCERQSSRRFRAHRCRANGAGRWWAMNRGMTSMPRII